MCGRADLHHIDMFDIFDIFNILDAKYVYKAQKTQKDTKCMETQTHIFASVDMDGASH